jgi:hypothetical protein
VGWQPIAILPNLIADKAIDGEFVAIVGDSDPRIQALCREFSSFTDLLGRFTDAFEVPVRPMALIARDDLGSPVGGDALLSFRDLVAISVVTHGRTQNAVYGGTGKIMWSSSFTLYPWTISNDYRYLVTSTPALTGMHQVTAFRGQSLPGVPALAADEIDEPLFAALLARWKAHYFGPRKSWKDRALFRSLDMAYHAAAIPSAVGTNLFDLGRSVAQWVSAFEALSHPGNSQADVETVYALFDKVAYIDRNVGRRSYAAKTGRKLKKGVKPPRRPLPCWMYGKLHHARNQFLHGNRVSQKLLDPAHGRLGLFWLAAPLYRLALSGFLGMTFDKRLP